MKIRILLLLCLMLPFAASFAQSNKSYQVKSPDGKITISISAGKTISWSVRHEETEVITPSSLSMTLSNGDILGINATVKNAKTSSADQVINTTVYKKDKVKNRYNQLTLTFKGDYGLIFRAYDDGMAY